ncbi:hypothetical protein B0I35DRAFT_37159 [Stachybotrys elegans]|uniref:BRE1-like coiled-coil containing domain-containing protein n=1 Tax=Stachybotrys elegans TaxID=80388 RepID=A0A8K0T5E2_9HYPO|nr:hypothetical protein B0I35DRAFT_37159 [Stachybotrys elegans]
MPLATTPSRPSTLAKMEDRKRPAVSSTDDMAPPSKRVAVNGSKVKEDAPEMKEESWIEAYTKGAIFRQMQEYSRKAATAESRLEELHKRSVHHDDHLRIIDAWWRQVLEELEYLAETNVSTMSGASGQFSRKLAPCGHKLTLSRRPPLFQRRQLQGPPRLPKAFAGQGEIYQIKSRSSSEQTSCAARHNHTRRRSTRSQDHRPACCPERISPQVGSPKQRKGTAFGAAQRSDPEILQGRKEARPR